MLPKLCIPQPSENWILPLLLVPIFISTFFVILKIKKIKTTMINKILLGIAVSFAVAVPVFIISFFVLLSFESADDPIAANYFSLNAAIKNTCYLDPQRNHCPKNLDELIAIEPEHFKPLLWGKKASYWYYPDTNEYTLIIKNDSWKGVIFDPKLATYPNAADFVDLIYNCASSNPNVLESGSTISDENWTDYLKTRNQIKF